MDPFLKHRLNIFLVFSFFIVSAMYFQLYMENQRLHIALEYSVKDSAKLERLIDIQNKNSDIFVDSVREIYDYMGALGEGLGEAKLELHKIKARRKENGKNFKISKK